MGAPELMWALVPGKCEARALECWGHFPQSSGMLGACSPGLRDWLAGVRLVAAVALESQA